MSAHIQGESGPFNPLTQKPVIHAKYASALVFCPWVLCSQYTNTHALGQPLHSANNNAPKAYQTFNNPLTATMASSGIDTTGDGTVRPVISSSLNCMHLQSEQQLCMHGPNANTYHLGLKNLNSDLKVHVTNDVTLEKFNDPS